MAINNQYISKITTAEIERVRIMLERQLFGFVPLYREGKNIGGEVTGNYSVVLLQPNLRVPETVSGWSFRETPCPDVHKLLHSHTH